ncbi:MAG TPA: hypothetical protein VJP02_01475 [Candidatus Sulfotelmatobacter sp.]|nr:hypothetical protein [Candidatus Sulfotelmatobacter sp.]
MARPANLQLSKLLTASYCGGVLLSVGGGVGGGLPFGFEGSCPVVPGVLDPDAAVPWVEAFGAVAPGVELFGGVFPGVDPLGVFDPGEVVAGGFVPGVELFGDPPGVDGLPGVVWGFVPPGGVVALPGAVVVPAGGVAAPGFELCPVVPEPPAGADPPEGELWAMTQHPQHNTTKSSNVSFLIDI